MTGTPIVEMKNMTMKFKGVVALDNVNFTLNRGEVVGLVGENGAGKSTLMKILYGAYKQTEGEMYVHGKKVNIENTSDAQKLGITMIYQELSLFLELSAVENIFINREISKRKNVLSKLNKKEMRERAYKILKEELGVEIELDRPVRELRLADRQLIEIARSLSADAEVIIMDEPTEALEIAEQEQLFKVIENLKSEGKAIVFVSHQLEQLLRVSDRVEIMRDGKNVASLNKEETELQEVISHMIGGQLHQQYPDKNADIADEILKVEHISKKKAYNDISFSLHRGEVLGLAGLSGAGKSEVLRSIFGAMQKDSGKIYKGGKELDIKNPMDAVKNGIAFLAADRRNEGLFLDQSVEWNLSISGLDSITKLKINKKKAVEYSDKMVDELSIKTSSIYQEISGLSGGNQQKVLLARWLMTEPDVILMEEPTRGVDVKAKAEIYRLIKECVTSGKGVIVMSSESPELIGICNRILVMYDGKIAKELDGDKTDEKEIALYSVQDMEVSNHVS